MCMDIYIEKRKGAAGAGLSAFRHRRKPAMTEFLGIWCPRNRVGSSKMAVNPLRKSIRFELSTIHSLRNPIRCLRNPFSNEKSTFTSLRMSFNRVWKTFVSIRKALNSLRVHISSAILAVRVTQLEMHRIQSHRSLVHLDTGRKTS